MNYNFIKEQLINKHGKPDDEIALDNYLNFVLDYKLDDTNEYTESHHILTRSQFPMFKDHKWNSVKLLYTDHIFAHELLFMSFNLRTYQRPLNYMKSDSWVNKNTVMISNAAKKGWKKLKNDEQKYKEWVEHRRAYMKNLSSKEQSRRAHKTWDSYTEDEYKNRCEISKKQWTNELREKRGKLTKDYLAKHPGEMKRRMQKRWQEINEDDYIAFKEKMTEVNNDIVKRKKAGETIKQKWEDPIFREKMKNRKSRHGGYVCISPNGETFIFDKKSEISQLKRFNYRLIGLFLNTHKPVEQPLKQANKEINKNTVGWVFYTKKFYDKWQNQLK